MIFVESPNSDYYTHITDHTFLRYTEEKDEKSFRCPFCSGSASTVGKKMADQMSLVSHKWRI